MYKNKLILCLLFLQLQPAEQRDKQTFTLFFELKKNDKNKKLDCGTVEFYTATYSVYLSRLIGENEKNFNENIICPLIYKHEKIESIIMYCYNGEQQKQIHPGAMHKIILTLTNNRVNYVGFSQTKL